MQQTLPVPGVQKRGSEWAGRADHKVLVDYTQGTLHPARLDVLPDLLNRVERYGVHRGLAFDQRCDVLLHSLLTAGIARHLFRSRATASEWDKSALHAEQTVWLYACLHDLGEVFGGDIAYHVPDAVKAVFQQYQSDARNRVQRQMGIPQPDAFTRVLIHAADIIAAYIEMERISLCEKDFEADLDLVASRMPKGLDIGRTDLARILCMPFVFSRAHGRSQGFYRPSVSKQRSLWRSGMAVRPQMISVRTPASSSTWPPQYAEVVASSGKAFSAEASAAVVTPALREGREVFLHMPGEGQTASTYQVFQYCLKGNALTITLLNPSDHP